MSVCQSPSLLDAEVVYSSWCFGVLKACMMLTQRRSPATRSGPCSSAGKLILTLIWCSAILVFGRSSLYQLSVIYNSATWHARFWTVRPKLLRACSKEMVTCCCALQPLFRLRIVMHPVAPHQQAATQASHCTANAQLLRINSWHRCCTYMHAKCRHALHNTAVKGLQTCLLPTLHKTCTQICCAD